MKTSGSHAAYTVQVQFLAGFETTTVTHWVDSRVRVDLQCVNVITGVLEQAVVGVEHLMRQQIEPLPAQTDPEGRRDTEGDETDQHHN